jgi:menaquinone-dependent protoporphyrinogen oxidase
MRSVRALEGYRAVVLGAPLYLFHLHRDAIRFLSRHQNALAGGLPVAIFAGGPFGTGDGNEWQEIRKQLDQDLARFPWLKPVAVEVIGASSTRPGCVFPGISFPPSGRCPPAICATGRRSTTGCKPWHRSFNWF